MYNHHANANQIDNSIELGRIFARSVTVRRYSTAT
jgi:hypothetical protein